ncbi:immunoglobulin superfamily member 5 isoform X5 [Sphaerodactylus townsendi]|uniref:immunoglobulin superfamily member 5 isoform X5 n=1 Tax=Sphaerodactylus townsendi TaxID=933632 RepID=UPI0020271B3B|nr:immunoglobulin superfamily member 5 isoform X5 [Sphaerodactylus townsendi]
MDSPQKCFWMTLSLLCFLTDPGFGFSIIEGPSNLTVLAGMEAHFNCTVSEGWQILIWLFEGQPVLSVTYPEKVIITDKSYGQKGYNKGTEFTSELIIYNVQLNNSGKIECSIQTTSGHEYAFLSVQESVTNEDDGRTQTIILAVVLSVVGFLLLILIILLIVYCCCRRRRKESKYQKEIQKASAKKKATSQHLETRRADGNENYGYSPEEHAKEKPRVPPFSPVNTSFYGPEQDLAVSSESEVPHHGNYDRVLPSTVAAYPINPRKIRNVTLV